MVPSETTPSSSADQLPSPSTSIVDGVTSENGGGREEGDVELALFRRIRSISNMSGRLTTSLQSPSYRRYFHHPLSMFSSETDTTTDATAVHPERDADVTPTVTPHGKAVASSNTASDPSIEQSHTHSLNLWSSRRRSPSSSTAISTPPPVAPASPTNPVPSHQQSQPQSQSQSQSFGVAWRDALVQACASMLGKTLDELRTDYNDVVTASTPSATTFASQNTTFEPIPRDLADYAIITTLKQQDPSTMQNAPSWLFNMMDRTGAGFVLRDEFVRYAPFIGPIADFAVAGIVFDELIREQVRAAAKTAEAAANELSRQQKRSDKQHQEHQRQQQEQQKKQQQQQQQKRNRSVNTPDAAASDDVGLRKRRVSRHPLEPDPNETTPLNHYTRSFRRSLSNGVGTENIPSTSNTPSPSAPETHPSPVAELRTADLFPPSAALRFDTWRIFFQAVQEKHHYVDDDWVRVKREVGIDPEETLIKSQGAVDHSDLLPTLGKLFLSQRYLIFFAAVGRNHYVVRLGAIADVSTDAIPIMMRDCVRITLESEAKVAMDGVTSVASSTEPNTAKPDKNNDAKGKGKGKGNGADGNHEEEQLSQYIGKLMRQFMSGRKPLLFSLLEFRETKRRDNWVNLIREMVAAYKLHAQLGFGSSGRAVRDVNKRNGKVGPSGRLSDDDDEKDDEEDSGGAKNGNGGGGRPGGNNHHHHKKGKHPDKDVEKRKNFSLNYSRSPFRSEPSPPLLAVAAHANIARYRALRRVTQKRVSRDLLVFSSEGDAPWLANWYTDSVRAYQSQTGRTWIERALAAIRENMDTNDRMYRVQDDEPFDIGKLGDEIGRFAELCSPLVRVVQFGDHLIQWRNPPATVLAILVCLTVAANGLVHYVPAAIALLQAAWVVETKVNVLGLGMGGAASEDAAQRRRNVLQLVAQVHDTLAAGQNVLVRLNRELGKLQTLFLWGCDQDRESWIAVGVLCAAALVLLVLPARVIFVAAVFFLFFKHFMPPSNPALRFWQSVPSRINVRRQQEQRQRNRGITNAAGNHPPSRVRNARSS